MPVLTQFEAAALADVPFNVRSSALEIECVVRGAKPAFHRIVKASHTPQWIAWLDSFGLESAIERSADGPLTGLQLSTTGRARLLSEPRFRLYSARTLSDARALRDADCHRRSPRITGRLLGYPECCVDFVCSHDLIDRRSPTPRQTNLNRLALDRAGSVSSFNNRMLCESPLSAWGPPALLAHYPCSPDCSASELLAGVFMEICLRVFPRWSFLLAEALRSPTLLWDDFAWQQSHWTETCGLCFLDGMFRGDEIIGSYPAIVLGDGETPAGPLPPNVDRVTLRDDRMIGFASGQSIDFSRFGRPAVVDWRLGRIVRRWNDRQAATRQSANG